MEKRSKRRQLILFVVISYAYLWLLFGIGRLFDISIVVEKHGNRRSRDTRKPR